MNPPRSWPEGEWVEVEVNGRLVRIRGATFKQYQSALAEANRRGHTGTLGFRRLLEEEFGADTEVVGRG
jgi:hypothetical protein